MFLCVVDMCDDGDNNNRYEGVPQYIIDKLQNDGVDDNGDDDDEDDDEDEDTEDKQGSVFEDEDSRDDDIDDIADIDIDMEEGIGYDEEGESVEGEIDENVREYRKLRHQQICEQLERHRSLDRGAVSGSPGAGRGRGGAGGKHPPNKYIKKCKSATFSLDGMMYTIGE